MPGIRKPRKSNTRPAPDRSWTIMVFMVADAQLQGFAMACLEQMIAARPAKHFDVVVQQFFPFTEPERMLVKGDAGSGPLPVSSGPRNPGSPQVLSRFLRDATEQFPASHYMLVLWGHALGFNFGHESDPTTALELARVLKEFSELRGRPLDVLGCDACRMSKIELAMLLRGSVDLIVASETGIPLTSWPYKQILDAVSNKPAMSPEGLGRAIIDNYCARYKPRGVSLAMLDLNHGAPVFNAVEGLAKTLLQAMDDRRELANLSDAIKTTSRDDVEPMIDLQEFCEKLRKGTSNASVRTGAKQILQLLEPPFIAKQGRSGPGVTHFRGVGIYVPRVLYDPAFGNVQVRKFFKWETPQFDLGTTWTQVIQRLVAGQISASQHSDS